MILLLRFKFELIKYARFFSNFSALSLNLGRLKLTKYIGDLVDYKGGYENARTYPGSVKRRCPDIMKAKNDLGYEPRYDWKTAVEMTVLWYKNYFESGNQPNEGGFVPPELIMKK